MNGEGTEDDPAETDGEDSGVEDLAANTSSAENVNKADIDNEAFEKADEKRWDDRALLQDGSEDTEGKDEMEEGEEGADEDDGEEDEDEEDGEDMEEGEEDADEDDGEEDQDEE